MAFWKWDDEVDGGADADADADVDADGDGVEDAEGIRDDWDCAWLELEIRCFGENLEV